MKRLLVAGLVGLACSGETESTTPVDGAGGAGAQHSAGGGSNGASPGDLGGTAGDGATGQAHSGNAGLGAAGEDDEHGGGSSQAGGSPAGGRGSGGLSGESSDSDGSSGEGGGDGCADGCASGPPRVLLLLDGSSSMFEPREALWDAAYSALMDPDAGAVALYEERIRFGFAAFRGSAIPLEEDDPACADIRSVPSALDNRDAIDALYSTLDDDHTLASKWETPTGHAIQRVVSEFAALDPDARKYLVIITDGHPNTCQILDPQCGQDVSVKAVQDARALGITTLVLGLGDILEVPGLCDRQMMRCGTDHLQDLANAGVGFTVEPPPPTYIYTHCVLNGTGTLLATYGQAGEGASARFYSVSAPEGLRVELESMLDSVLAGDIP